MCLTDDTQDAKSGRSSHLSERGAGSEKRELRYAFGPEKWQGSLPLPKRPVVVKVDDVGGIISRDVVDLEALSHLALDELRSALIALVGVLVKDGGVVLLRRLAAFDHQEDQAVKLRVGVVGVVHVGGGLESRLAKCLGLSRWDVNGPSCPF